MPEPGLVVLDSWPIIGLAAVGQLDVVGKLYPTVLIPGAVHREVTIAGAGLPGAQELTQAAWGHRVDLESPLDPLVETELGLGEAEVIILARRSGAELALLDDHRARRIAELAYGLKVRGTAGILVTAKREGLITSVRPLLEKMRSSGYYLSHRLVEYACKQVAE